jgi:integrase
VLAEHQERSEQSTSPWMFTGVNGKPLNPASFSATFDRLVTRSGLPRIRVHDLRHTHATSLGVGVHPVVSERLGHSSIAITIDLYSHVMPGINVRPPTSLSASCCPTTQPAHDMV